MSIYMTIFDIGEEHKRSCAKMSKMDRNCYSVHDTKLCTCGSSPLIYQGSHILPSDTDKRGGVLMLGAIPSHITRDGRDDDPEGRWYPWLRVDFFDTKNGGMILNREQATALRDALTSWILTSAPLMNKRGKKIRRKP